MEPFGLKRIDGTTEDELKVFVASDREIGIGVNATFSYPDGFMVTYLRTVEARELAEHLLKLIEQIETGEVDDYYQNP